MGDVHQYEDSVQHLQKQNADAMNEADRAEFKEDHLKAMLEEANHESDQYK